MGQENPSAKPGFLDQYLPQELIIKLQAARSGDSLAGERRVITMLFCDVKGSTAAAETMDPEVWTEIINGAFERMIAPIYKYEGLVPRLMGDAILAFFGAPIAHEDDPQRAILAGLEIQAGIKTYAEQMRARHDIELGLRVGINTGLVVVGEIGSDLRMEYTAIGDAINLAARMEQTAQPGTVQVTGETYKLVAPLFDFEALGDIEVKGKAELVEAYRVLAPKQTPGPLRGLEGLYSPLVGRAAQLSLFEEFLARLSHGAGSFTAVVGEAGLGKSSLVAEVQKLGAASGVTWFRGDALSYARSTSYFLWRQVLRQSLNAHEGDPPAEVRKKLRSACQRRGLPSECLPFLEAILAVESPDSLQVLSGLQGEDFVGRITEAARGYLSGLTGEAPLALIFDDLHWADEASLTLLINLADLVAQQPLLFICMTRPENHAAFVDPIRDRIKDRFCQIDLEPLQDDQASMLLTNLVGAEGLPGSVREQILKKVEGNPYFVEEIIRSLIETKQIVREDSHWRAADKDVSLSLPGTLNGVLSARIDRLPEGTKQLLQMASVIGRSFDLRLLRGLSNLNGDMDGHIQRLTQSGLIQPLEPEEYIFRHVLVQEAAYNSTLIKRRRLLHLRIGEILEGSHAERLEEYAPLLAYHFYNAEDPRSLKYDLLAGEKAEHLYANAEAATHYSRALETAKRLAAGSDQVGLLYRKIGHVLELDGSHVQALANYEEMETFARACHDPSLELESLTSRATIYSIFTHLHSPLLAQKMLVRALDLAQQIGDHASQAKLHWGLMLNYLFSKVIDKAVEHGEQGLALARGTGDREQLAFILNDLTRVYTCTGEFDKGYAVVHEARELWRTLENQAMLADNFGAEAEAGFNAGDYARALDCAARSLEISETTGNIWGQAYNNMLVGFVTLDQGEVDRAIPLMQDSVRLGDQAGLLASSVGERAELGWVYGSFGDIEKGLETCRESLKITLSKLPAWRPLPEAMLVRVLILKGDLAGAQEIVGPNELEVISIPYAHYTILVEMANIELALAKKDFAKALSIIDRLRAQIPTTIRPDIPELLWHKGQALLGLGQIEAAWGVLLEACNLAEALGSRQSLWRIFSLLAEIESGAGNKLEADVLREKARQTVSFIADCLQVLGLKKLFLAKPDVRAVLN
jgi:class 3 adenylate cyclase/tetratricopeptide (TPR) repeat protein